ncbi:MAG: hypothetical protein LBQ69_04795 [Treponema sp.]|nr:hypothetical protein [Treponema sp.]
MKNKFAFCCIFPKPFILPFIILIMAVPVHAQENFVVNFNSGYIGYGGNFPLNDNYDYDFFVTPLSIGMEHLPTNIGFEFTFYNFFGWVNSGKYTKDNNGITHSLFNLHLYWNVLSLVDGFIFFGPFTSVNYVFVGENVYWDKFVFTVGGQAGLKLNFRRLNYNIVSAEIGYRNISGRSQYFFGVKVDVASFFLFLILAGESK